MELSQYKFKVIIKANCHEICSDDELSKLKDTYEEFNFNEVKSFAAIVSHEPTYKTLTNKYRIPDEYNWNEKYKKEATGLDEIMNVEEIKSIDYFDYVGEKIYSVINQQKSWASDEFDVADGKQLKMVLGKFKQFLFNKSGDNVNVKLVEELDNLIYLAAIAEKYEKEMWFYDGYFWQ